VTEKELMKFVIERSNDPIIKNPVLRDAMNKDLGPRNMYAQGQLVSNTVDGSRPGYGGKEGRHKIKMSDWTLEQKANLETWMDNTGSTLEDYNKLPSSTKNNIKYARITGIRQTPEFAKKLESTATKQFRNWLNKQDPKTLTANSVDDLIQQSKIKTTSKNQRSGLVNAINRILEEKEFSNFKNIKLGREYSQKNIEQLSDDLLKAYAKDDITLVMDPKHKSSISEIRTNRRGTLDKAIKNTGLDEETIFNLLDDREAYVELEHLQATTRGRPVDPNKAKFYKQAENWIVKNSKRYADPDKFKKAFTRTFGKDNNLIQKINKTEVLGKRGSTLGSVPFSDWFRTNIMGSSEQGMRGQTKPSYSGKQLNQIFKTAIYTNNENVRNKIINELTNILPEEGSRRTPDIRDKFKNSPILKKFGLNQKIDGPIARLLAKEVGDDLLKQVSLFRKPFLGTTELITYLKDRVNPKYKSMFEEAAKATGFAQRNSWPQARQALNSSNSIMFDHKIPKALIEAGYADEIEYIKLNPTSDKFNTTIKRTQFDQPMIKLSKEFEITKSLDGKAKVVEKMNELKNNFSKKYGGYLDEISITPDKTGKPMFKSSASPITKKTDLVSSLGKSMVQAGEIKSGTPLHNKLMKFCPKDVGGTAGVCSLDEAMRGMKEESKMLKSGKLNKPQAEQIAKKFNAVRRVGTGLAKGSKLMSWLGPYGLGGEIALEGMFVANDMLENGMTYKEALSNSVLRYALPKNQREKLEYNEDRNRKILGNDRRGLAADYVSGLKKQEDLIKSYNKFNKMNETEGVGDIDGSDIYDYKDIYKAEKDFGKDYDRMSPTYGKNIFDIVKYGSPEQQAFAAKEEGFDVRAMENRMEYDKKLLGPLGKEDFYSQAQLDMLDAKALSESKRIGKRSNEIKTQEVANFGGVANMAHGGIMNLRRKK